MITTQPDSILRTIPVSMDGEIVAQVDKRLADLRQTEKIGIPLAIESGSRAWGFPSPDSDYDCRFIYVRRAEDYLSLWPRRDVIETPIDRVFDVNGWDLAKALKLLVKGNAVVIEWLTSPISYSTDIPFRDAFLALARSVADRALVQKHYLHLGERQRRTYFRDSKPIPQKKIFYALRPAAALRWLRLYPDSAVAPMHFPTLLAECAPPGDVIAIVDDLITRKALTREMGSEMLSEPIGDFIDTEFRLARETASEPKHSLRAEARARCDAFFRSTVLQMG